MSRRILSTPSRGRTSRGQNAHGSLWSDEQSESRSVFFPEYGMAASALPDQVKGFLPRKVGESVLLQCGESLATGADPIFRTTQTQEYLPPVHVEQFLPVGEPLEEPAHP